MFPWVLGCIAAVAAVIVLVIKMRFLYQDLKEISVQFHDRLSGDTNNVIYVHGNDRHLKAFAECLNRELRILYDRRRKYQNGDRELKEAVTNISHDLRTPLTAIYGYLELLEAEPKSETVAHDLAQIRDRTDALAGLTEELFRYSILVSAHGERSEKDDNGADHRAVSNEKVILNRVLADCLLSYYDIFKKNAIEPEVIIPDGEVVRFLDAGALKRIFGNILDNAIKYCKPAVDDMGIVSGRLSGNPEKPENSENPARDAALKTMRVELFSDGTVIFCNSAQNLDKVSVERFFDRFYTVETGRNSTGLGLSIARLLTERMGGSISADYKDGELTIRLEFKKL